MLKGHYTFGTIHFYMTVCGLNNKIMISGPVCSFDNYN